LTQANIAVRADNSITTRSEAT